MSAPIAAVWMNVLRSTERPPLLVVVFVLIESSGRIARAPTSLGSRRGHDLVYEAHTGVRISMCQAGVLPDERGRLEVAVRRARFVMRTRRPWISRRRAGVFSILASETCR